MPDQADVDRAVEQFLRDQIDTIPYLEALLLLWGSRPKAWSIGDIAKGLYLTTEAAAEILGDLARQGLVTLGTGAVATYRYDSHPDRDKIVASVESTYRRELIRVSGLIHSKPSAAVRAFAPAFRIKKDNK